MRTKIKSIFGNDLLKKGINDSNYYMIANIGSKALGFLVIPILARSVGVKEFANYDLFLLISSFLQILVTLGIDSGIAILMSESKNDHQKLSFYYTITLVISVCFLFFIMLLINSWFLIFDELFLLDQQLWMTIGTYVLFNIINYHTFNFLRWQTEAKKAALINLFAYVSGVLMGLALLYANKIVLSYLYGLVIGSLIGTIVSLYIARDYIRNFKFLDNWQALLKELFKLSLPFVPNYIGKNLMQMADRVVILMLFGKYELGLYAVILRIAQIPQFLSTTITGGFLPVMYNNYKTENGQNLIRNFFHFYLIMIPVSFIIFYFLADWAVALLGGKDYTQVAYLLPMALVSILFVNGTQGTGFGYTIARKTHYIMYITFLSIGINFILSIVLGLWLGLAGIFIGTLIAGILRTYLHVTYSEKLYSFHYNLNYLLTTAVITIALSIGSYMGTL